MSSVTIKLILAWLLLVNAVGFLLMGVDKRRAVRGAWRIPERILFMTALLGGSLGSILGMQTFHHKTKHWQFRYGLPAILAVQAAVVLYAVKGDVFT